MDGQIPAIRTISDLSLKECHAALRSEQTKQRVNEIKTTSAYKSAAQLIQQGQPFSVRTTVENYLTLVKANEELKTNPSEQTKTEEREKKHETQRRAPAVPDEPLKVTFNESPPGEGSRRRCCKFSYEIQDAYEEMNMWYTPEDEDRFETDFASLQALREVELTVTQNNNKVVVARRKFPSRKTVPCAKPVKQQAQSLVPPKANSTSRPQAKPHHNQSEEVAKRQATKGAHSNPRNNPLVLTAAEKRRIKEFEWKKVTKGTKHKSSNQTASPITTSNSYQALSSSEKLAPAARPVHIKPEDILRMMKANKAAKKERKRRDLIKFGRSLQKMEELRQKHHEEKEALLANEEEVLLATTTEQQPPVKGAAKVQRMLQHIQCNEEEKKRSAHRRSMTRADIQRAQYLASKYGDLSTAFKVMDYLDRPTKTKLKKLKAREAAKKIVADARRTLHSNDKPADLIQEVAESWSKRDKPTSILDTGYLGANIITPQDTVQAGLKDLGPSDKRIRDANRGISQASARTRVKRDGLPPEVGEGIIAPSLTNSLTGGTTFADAGLIMIFHPHFGGVTIHKPEDVNIDYTGDPVATGFRERTGHRFWRIPIEAPETPETEQMPMSHKLSLVKRLLLSKSPKIEKEQLSNATEILHNVYELPSIEQGIRWMHATCG